MYVFTKKKLVCNNINYLVPIVQALVIDSIVCLSDVRNIYYNSDFHKLCLHLSF